jgi:hypothetical protein
MNNNIWKIKCFRPGKNRPISGGIYTSALAANTRLAELRKLLPSWTFELVEPNNV